MLEARWRRDAVAACADVARRHGWKLVLLFAGVLLPMWLFMALADEVHEAEAIPFDAPILRVAHAMASERLDRVFLFFSAIGYERGVVPFDVLLVLGLAIARRFRQSLFAAVALAGSGLLNVATKQLFARERPSLWESISPESTFSFPSGHAMGSMTLACVLLALTWRTRLRWWVVGAMAVFVPMVGLSRVYLGVHYPSDILAGWAVALTWVVAVWFVLRDRRATPGDAG